MLNMIRMDLYRMFRTKSLYVIFAIMLGMLLFTMTELQPEIKDGVMTSSLAEQQQEVASDSTNIGITSTLLTAPGEKVTLFDLIASDFTGKILALYMVIFAVLFGTADISSGYIKNYAGQVNGRWKLVLSKAISLFFYVLLVIGVEVLFQWIFSSLFLGKLPVGNVSHLLSYLGIQCMLHFALVCICLALGVMLRNNLVSMIFSVCLCMNVFTIFYAGVNKLLEKMGVENFSIMKYTVTCKISALSMAPTWKEGGTALAVAGAFIVIFLAAAGFIFQKRDV